MKLTKLWKQLVVGLVIFFSWTGICLAEDLVVTMLDVGQADSIMIQTAGKTVLIDAGEDKDLTKTLLEKKGIQAIDLLVATHPHSDHIGGMQAVLSGFNIKVYMDNGFPHTTKQYEELMEVAESKVGAGMKYMTARKGQRLNLGKEAHFEVLWPNDDGVHNTRSDINGNSIVLKLVHGDVCMLFTGDAEAETEQAILADVDKCQVYKVSHHGSPHSSIPELVQKIRPDIALISCGLANKHGHPGQSTLDSLRSVGSQIYRTDWNGEIQVVSDGHSVRVKTEKDLGKADLPCIDVNRSDISEFSALKGVGKTTTDRIVEARKAHPEPFASVDDFLAALPQDPAHRLSKLRDYLSTDCSAVKGGAAPAVAAPVAAPAVVAAPTVAAAPAAGGLVNINYADANALASMPGMDAKKAAAAVEYRNQNGAFASCQDLKKVNGIGPKTVEKLLSSCTTSGAAPAAAAPVAAAPVAAAPAAGGLININTADANAIATMPGMSAKKAADAVEYRNQNGPFGSCQDLKKVNGIGPKTVEKLLSSCTVQ